METEKQVMLFRDAGIPPSAKTIEVGLGQDVYRVYKQLLEIMDYELGLNAEWNFYKDGKAWLCKVSFKKKTILWLSVWENLIKISFYFTEKTIPGLLETDISSYITNTLHEAKKIGKLIPLTLGIQSSEQLADVRKIILYKKNLK